MEVFIVRPFGIKTLAKRDKNTGKLIEEIDHDFDSVETELIVPAMQNLNLTGGTTGKIFESGDIREDMFSLLLSSDIVIADITMHNANVFYELGIRHSLRDKKTILIKCNGFDDTPFDIIGYRYVVYEKDNPSAALPALIATLTETMIADRKDSPVFNLLPKLESQSPEKLVAIPVDFTEETEIAARSNQIEMLSVLATEVKGFHWEIPAIRMIGEALFTLKAYENSRIMWEKILKTYPNDTEANESLATIYQRLAETLMLANPEEGVNLLIRSDIAIEKLLNALLANERHKLSEAFSLKGRNEKARWLHEWRKLPASEWSTNAIKSASLFNAFEYYKKAYYEDLNHFYSGINTLGLLTVIIHLANACPDIWELRYETNEEADQKLKELKENHQNLTKCIRLSIDAAKSKLKETGITDNWLNITEADFACLTSTNPARVAVLYKNALKSANPLNTDATIRQLKIYEQLNVVSENVKAALAVLPEEKPTKKEEQIHYLLFTGHMIDTPDREEPRFLASNEGAVSQKIKKEIEKMKSETNGKLFGIAGGACGGDIIFHEICQELEITTDLYLALPREQFIVESVAFAGESWIGRFDKLYEKIPHHILSQTKELPKWLQKKKDYTIWERNNLWELNRALTDGGINMTLIALWDGKGGDGPGGTADMVKLAKARGAKTIIIKPDGN